MGGSALRLGQVGRAHGLKGEVHVQLDWQQSRALEQAPLVALVQEGKADRRFSIRSCRPATKGYLVHFEGVDTREEAEALQGAAVFADRADLPPLEAGEYYLTDTVGMEVFAAGQAVGTVEGAAVYPSVDVVVIRTAEGRLLEQPLVEPWIVAVDVAQNRLELSGPDGLIDVRAGREVDEAEASSEGLDSDRAGRGRRRSRARSRSTSDDVGSGGSAS